jgi:4-amino-4-deoxy-L-arabinose transferase-like glycosyltransferase
MNRKVFIYLLPLFVLYCIAFSLLADKTIDYGDEVRYAMYAENLTKGFYAPPDTLLLWNGPGYPLLLAPFAYFHVPWIYAKMFNPVFIFIAVCLFFSVIRNFTGEKTAVFFTYLFGLYPPFFAEMQYLLTEPFSLMLMSLFALLCWKWFADRKACFAVLAALVFAFVALTKVFFGYVALCVLLLSLVTCRWKQTMKMALPVYAGVLLFCAPYLFYTWHLTGKIFYWANSGGSTLYWMASPDSNDLGSWFTDKDVLKRPELAYHRPFFEKLQGLNYVEQDHLLKQKAFENAVHHPGKVLLNYVSNLGRLFLNFPFSYKYQRPQTLLYTVPNCLVLAAIVFSLYPLIKMRKFLPRAIVHACVLSVIALGGQSMTYAEARYLCPILPFIFIVVVYVSTNLIKIGTPRQEIPSQSRQII